MSVKDKKNNRNRNMFYIFAAVTISFVLAIIVSIWSLASLARENTKEIDTMLTYRIYDSISSSLNEPIIVAKTMACNDFLSEFIKNEDSMSEDEAIAVMQQYLSSVKNGLEYDSAFLISEKSRRYYTYEGLNKIVDPENDDHDIWYSIFVEKNKPYDLDVDSDEMNKNQWTVFVNARIEDENGELLGVCGVGVKMTNLQELFLKAEKEYDVKINLVDKNGLVQVDTDDINIENAWLDTEVLSQEETDEYKYQTTSNNEFAVSKYVEYLGWYLVVRSAPTSISKEFLMIIIGNIVLFLFVMIILIFTVSVILKRTRKERDERERLLILSERAMAASEAKSSFLSSMSHEIRTPINAVLGMNEMILRETHNGNILEYATNIQNAGKTLLYLINSILDFSKIEEGKMEIVPVRYDTVSLINNIVATVTERARSKKLDLILDIDKNLPSEMFGDDVRISQVIMNILTNAVKYTEQGYVKFTVRKEKSEGDRIELFVSVEDTGIGIKKEDLPKLFESFERLDVEKNHSIEGTGLGMSIVVNLLRMMDSKIEVESEYGKGSTFYFTISQQILNETPIGDYTGKTELICNKDTITFRAEKAKILVVDDNEMNLKVAKNLLGLFGITPHVCGSGLEAIECLRKEKFDMILLDHMMPKMDGIETLARIKEENLIVPETAVIALTANAINGAREQYLEAGFHDYLSKPIEVEQLEEQLRKWLPEDVLKEQEDEILEFAPESSDSDTVKIHSNDFLDKLEEIKVDTRSGIHYCAGDKDFYFDTLSDYVGSYAERISELNEFFEAKAWNDFEIRIHAVKSASKTIGAAELSEKALKLETAASKLEADYIEENYPSFAEDYAGLTEQIKQIING
ncbi:MAG: response regulator [Lachnospiraceae bacterium]|nr:response regulator [Lachnospiraceae bacterium]